MAPMDIQFQTDDEVAEQPRTAVPSPSAPASLPRATQPPVTPSPTPAPEGSIKDTKGGSPQSAQQELDAIMNDKKHPYWDLYSGSEAHKAAVQTVQALHQKIAGEQMQEQKGAPDVPPEERPTDVLPNPPSGWDVSEERAVRGAAVELGVPPAMVNEVVDLVAKAGPSAVYDTAEELEAAARTRWGNDYDAKLYYAHLVVREVGPTLAEYLNSSGQGNSMALFEYFSRIGETLETTQQRINTLQRNPAYLDASHLDHRAALVEMKTLQETRHFLKRDLR